MIALLLSELKEMFNLQHLHILVPLLGTRCDSLRNFSTKSLFPLPISAYEKIRFLHCIVSKVNGNVKVILDLWCIFQITPSVTLMFSFQLWIHQHLAILVISVQRLSVAYKVTVFLQLFTPMSVLISAEKS